MIKINGKNYETTEVIKVEIGKKTYSLPLMKHLKYKEIKRLIALQNEVDIEAIMEVLSAYIPMNVLEELSIVEISQIMAAWKEVSAEQGSELGN